MHQIGFYRVIIESVDEYDDDGYDSNIEVHSNSNFSNPYVTPSVLNKGTNVTLTITLNNEDFGRPVPPLQNNQGVLIPIESIQIGSINSNNISNINRISRFVTTCDIFIPNNTESSIFDMIITYIGPSGNKPTITVDNAIMVN